MKIVATAQMVRNFISEASWNDSAKDDYPLISSHEACQDLASPSAF